MCIVQHIVNRYYLCDVTPRTITAKFIEKVEDDLRKIDN